MKAIQTPNSGKTSATIKSTNRDIGHRSFPTFYPSFFSSVFLSSFTTLQPIGRRSIILCVATKGGFTCSGSVNDHFLTGPVKAAPWRSMMASASVQREGGLSGMRISPADQWPINYFSDSLPATVSPLASPINMPN